MKITALAAHIADLEERAALVYILLEYIDDLEAAGRAIESEINLHNAEHWRTVRALEEALGRAKNADALALRVTETAGRAAALERQNQALRQELEGWKAGVIMTDQSIARAAETAAMREQLRAAETRIAQLEKHIRDAQRKKAERAAEIAALVENATAASLATATFTPPPTPPAR